MPDNAPTWGVMDLLRWKVVPERLGGGIPYIQRFKDLWVRHNKVTISDAARRHSLPPELLAGVCWIEVAGDPSFIDRVAFEVRAFDWSGPNWVDQHMTATNNPAKTSFGAVSMQLRTAAQTLGMNVSQMSEAELRSLARSLQTDVYNIEVAARHLRQLAVHDGFQAILPNLSMDEVRVIGARYNRGMGLTLEQIKTNTSYGDFIVRIWTRLQGLLK
jgi:hypothetical protein